MITLDDLKNCTLRETTHLNGPSGPKGWFGYMYECIQYPRLQRRVRYFRRDRSHDVTWYVDGAEVYGVTPETALAHATDLLNQPPTLTPEEQAVLDKVTGDFVDHRQEMDVTTLLMLRSKGMIEFKEGKCRRLNPAKAEPTA
jgi:hypothetical protein